MGEPTTKQVLYELLLMAGGALRSTAKFLAALALVAAVFVAAIYAATLAGSHSAEMAQAMRGVDLPGWLVLLIRGLWTLAGLMMWLVIGVAVWDSAKKRAARRSRR